MSNSYAKVQGSCSPSWSTHDQVSKWKTNLVSCWGDGGPGSLEDLIENIYNISSQQLVSMGLLHPWAWACCRGGEVPSLAYRLCSSGRPSCF